MNTEANPDNPLCPICGAADWFSDPRVELGLLVMLAGEKGEALKDREGKPEFLPLNAFICRSCRFTRLQSARGDLKIRFPAQ